MITSDCDANNLDIIPRLIDYLYETSKCSNANGGEKLQWRMTIGFRKFVALSWIMRPSAVAKGTHRAVRVKRPPIASEATQEGATVVSEP